MLCKDITIISPHPRKLGTNRAVGTSRSRYRVCRRHRCRRCGVREDIIRRDVVLRQYNITKKALGILVLKIERNNAPMLFI